MASNMRKFGVSAQKHTTFSLENPKYLDDDLGILEIANIRSIETSNFLDVVISMLLSTITARRSADCRLWLIAHVMGRCSVKCRRTVPTSCDREQALGPSQTI
ncbi:hypothetical protein HAX54_020056 [Datura stramonium]|uniref:Uncharacterized protein n=1 Tax=Datura stramonium TaxID=4076 RepID=A0ABS8USJ7_DATST|nr:hypothetical protein [Datura stramonium]